MAKRQAQPLWRHGDVLVTPIAALPEGAEPQPSSILARGEATGHAHRIQDPRSVELYRKGADRFLRVVAESAVLIHEEHAPITLPRGLYRYWQQREYTPAEIRTVVD